MNILKTKVNLKFMYYSININQIAIESHNKKYNTNFDLVDGAILEYLQKQSTSSFAKRNYKIFDGLVFYLLFYDNIITQLPLIKIYNRESIGRRIKKLVEAKVILQKVEKIPNNGTKIYFTTTDIFESFFSYDSTQKSDGDSTQKLDGDSTQKSGDIIDKNITNKNITDKKDTASDFSLSSKKSDTKEKFQELWEVYHEPKKTIQWEKMNALQTKTFKIFEKRIKESSFEELLDNTKQYLQYKKLETSGTSKMSFDVFLNGKCFEDYKGKIEDICKKQNKTIPQLTRTEEERQVEETIKERRERKYTSIFDKLTDDGKEFTKKMQEIVKSSYSSPIHDVWIKKLLAYYHKKENQLRFLLFVNNPKQWKELQYEKVLRILKREAQERYAEAEIKFDIEDFEKNK